MTTSERALIQHRRHLADIGWTGSRPAVIASIVSTFWTPGSGRGTLRRVVIR